MEEVVKRRKKICRRENKDEMENEDREAKKRKTK